MPYQRINWKNGEAGGTPLNESNLNKMDSQIAQNVADIDELKNKPGGAMLVLTNASPLPATDSKPILGIDAKGKGEQSAPNLFVASGYTSDKRLSGTDGGNYGDSTDFVSGDASGMYTSALIEVASNTTYTRFSKAENYFYRTAFYNASKVRIGKADTKVFTTPNNTKYIAISGYVSELGETYVKLSTPTPTSPIPIVDASGEVVARTVNMFDAHYGYHNTSNGFASGQSKAVGCADHLLNCNVGDSYVVTVGAFSTQTTAWVGYYNADGSMISRSNSAQSFTIPSGCSKFFVSVYSDGITDGNYPQIQLEKGTTATSYVPYQSNTITLPYTLRSVGTVADELIVNEDGSGKLIRRVGVITFNGAENWQFASATTNRVYVTNAPLGNASSGSASSNMAKFGGIINAGSEISNAPLNQFYLNVSTTESYLWVTTDLTSADAWKSILQSNNMVVYYPLATPIETPLTASEVASIRQLQTYKGTTVIDSEMQIDSVTYAGDIKAYIDYRIEQIINPTALNEVAPMNLDETEE